MPCHIVEVTAPKYLLHKRNGGPVETDACFANKWCSPEGQRALFVTNFRTIPQTISIDGKPLEMSPLQCMVVPLSEVHS